jgi:hypothetical protein
MDTSVWVVAYDGDYAARDAEYDGSPERETLDPDPARHIASSEKRFSAAVELEPAPSAARELNVSGSSDERGGVAADPSGSIPSDGASEHVAVSDGRCPFARRVRDR